MKSIVAFWMTLAVAGALTGCAVTPSTGVVVGPGPETAVCCHEFPVVLSRRVRPVLAGIQGVTRLQRVNTTDGSLCYRFHYEGPAGAARSPTRERASHVLHAGVQDRARRETGD